MIRVMIVDDDQFVVTGIQSMLAEESDLVIVATVNDGQEAIERLNCTAVDVILMDLRMPGMGGVEATSKIKLLSCPPQVLALTTWNTDSLLRDALRAGVDGFLLKDATPSELATAIRTVFRRRTVLSPEVADRLVAAFTESSKEQQSAAEAFEKLSELEKEVAVAIADGLTNSEIASQKYMSVGNVKACVSRILFKLGFSNRVQIATMVHQAQ
ncbi:response regulator protein two-component system [Corynebacterium ulcerans 809]|uniref:response regulator transcription factor n=1 Tax=Corynebacterium ulcerans TaxID=65058 RepID=UPI0002185471|nr:response regulator transcription factor [Corynebacterium ulcerans]AEG80597.1 response regulator protein two-component system [Corynebacterium ulcerans 809]